jgi:hypothetical protein
MSYTRASTPTPSATPAAGNPPAPPETSAIPGFDKMSFAQQRQAQDQNAARRNSR